MPRSQAAPRPEQSVSVKRTDFDVFEMVFEGFVTVRAVELATSKVMGFPGIRLFLLDASTVTGYDTDVRVPGAELLGTLRKVGVEYGVCVAPSSTVRLIGAAVSFVSNVKVDFVANRDDAFRRLTKARHQLAPAK